MPEPYYSDELVTLYHGKCEEITEWLAAAVLVTDPPYGRGWKRGPYSHGVNRGSRDGITGDLDTSLRDSTLALWGDDRPSIAFGDLMMTPPAGTKQVLIYRKPGNSGFFGSVNGYRRDVEGVYLLGPWPTVPVRASSVVTTAVKAVWSLTGGSCGHPHAKPVDVMEQLIRACPPGVIADPFAGAGSTLVAARNLGRKAIGVELEEKYCERAALRLSQMVFA